MYSIGVDLGGTNIAVGTVGEDLKITDKLSIPVKDCTDAQSISDRIGELCLELIRRNGTGISELESIGIAVPGATDKENGRILRTVNLPMSGFPLVDSLRKKTGFERICLGNDADAAALGEYCACDYGDVKDFIMVTLGTGVGGGIIINGRLYSGFNGTGGEIGHMVIVHDGLPCSCGRRGCFEQYASATALIRMTRELAEREQDSPFAQFVKEYGSVNAKLAFDALRSGVPGATELIEKYVSFLTTGLINLVNILQPEILCIGGGISKEGKFLTDMIDRAFEKEGYSHFADKNCRTVTAKLGNDAGIVGAARLSRY